MKKLIYSLVILLAFIFNKFFIKNKKIIIYYHDITDDTSCKSRSRVGVKIFRSHLNFLKKCGYKFITTEQMVMSLKNNKCKGKFVSVHFDDGLLNNYTNASRVLYELKIPFDIFVITGMIGQKTKFSYSEMRYGSDLKDGYDIEFMKLDNLKAMKKMGAQIHPHSHTHPMFSCAKSLSLTKLSDNELRSEISLSKKIIESYFEKNVELFVYPIGDFNNKVIDILKLENFVAAFTIINRPIRNGDNLYIIPRMHPGNSIYTMARTLLIR